jgi:hypothetical protein
MSSDNGLLCVGLKAAADLSAKQHYLVKVTAADTVNVAADATAAILGVLQDNPDAANKTATVAYGGIAKVKAGGTIAIGDAITGTTGGAALATTTAGDWIIGHAVDAAASGDLFRIRIAPSRY